MNHEYNRANYEISSVLLKFNYTNNVYQWEIERERDLVQLQIHVSYFTVLTILRMIHTV